MKSAELREFLKRYSLSQDDFAKMVGASLRSVSAWLSEGGTDIPGPAEAYSRLFTQLSEYGRQLEILRARGQGIIMRDGVFLISYSSLGIPGWCTLTLDQGTAYGFDLAGGMYDGTYKFDATRQVADVELQVTIPPNVAVVWGPAKPYTWSFVVKASLDPNADHGQLRLANELGPEVDVSYRFMRSLPVRPVPTLPKDFFKKVMGLVPDPPAPPVPLPKDFFKQVMGLGAPDPPRATSLFPERIEGLGPPKP